MNGAVAFWRYLKAAFWLSPPIPGLGHFPLNLVLVLGFAILGLGQPAFWLLGFGLEVGYLLLAATSPRFQRLVQAQARLASLEASESRTARLVKALSPEERARLNRLEERCGRLLRGDTAEAASGERSNSEGNRDAVQRLSWTFLKLLVAQQYLQSAEREADAIRLDKEIAGLKAELDDPDILASLRSSKQATLRILVQRLANVSRRAAALEQIVSDLNRIEQQVELAVEEAGMPGEPAIISADVDLLSDLLDDSFGAAGPDVAALDRRYGTPAPRQSERLSRA